MDRGKNPNCLLGYWPYEQPDLCNPNTCKTCGWRPEVERARKAELIKKYANRPKGCGTNDEGTTQKL